MRGAIAILAFGSALNAATLEQLSIPQLIDKATVIVKGSIASCRATERNHRIYTVCRLNVQELWKGQASGAIEVWNPGGVWNGIRQTYSGAPDLHPGDARIFFLWRGTSGINHVLGLSQGVLRIEKDSDGTPIAVRTPVRDRMLDASGQAVWDPGVDIPLVELRRTVQRGGR